MKIISVCFANLNSLRVESAIEFSEGPLAATGLFAIVGPTGSGKTTLLDAITLGLYGEVARYTSKSELNEGVMSFGAGRSYAQVVFEVNADRYRAEWRIARAHGKADGKIRPAKRLLEKWQPQTHQFVPIADGVHEVKAEVERITGLDYSRFCRSVLLAQGDFAAFLNADKSTRSGLLERITGTEIYGQLSQAAHDRFVIESQRVKDIELQLGAIKIMAEDELAVLQKESQQLEQDQKQQEQRAEHLRQAVQWWQRWESAESNLAKAKSDLAQHQQAASAMLPLREMLRKHQQLLPLQGLMSQWQTSSQQEIKLTAAKTQLGTQVEVLTSKVQTLTTSVEQSKQRTASAEAEEQRLRKLLDQSEPLEKRRFELKTQQDEINRQTELLSKQAATAREKIETIKAAHDQAKQQIKTTEAELAVLNMTPEQAQLVPKISEKRQVLRELYKQRLALNKE